MRRKGRDRLRARESSISESLCENEINTRLIAFMLNYFVLLNYSQAAHGWMVRNSQLFSQKKRFSVVFIFRV